jgi:hypothetical protein
MDAAAGEQKPRLSLAAVRDALVREEDSVVFAIIERARHSRNAPAYAPAAGGGRPLVESFVREAEALQAKASILLPCGSSHPVLGSALGASKIRSSMAWVQICVNHVEEANPRCDLSS